MPEPSGIVLWMVGALVAFSSLGRRRDPTTGSP
ncbi:MAG: hypothetical protein ACC645_19685 [Pirellulales bacterium]